MSINDVDQSEDSGLEDQTEDFAALFEADGGNVNIVRDSQIEGTIVSINDEWVFVDVGGKSEGAITREELTDRSGGLLVNIGEPIKAYVVKSQGDDLLLSVKMTSGASEGALRDAKDSGIPVEGIVTAERKGGYTVTVFGKPAFCPFSQMDLHPGGRPEDYIGQRFTFRVMEYSEKGRNIVLSRRQILEEERLVKLKVLRETLQSGAIVEGTVQKLAPFGAFVEIGGTEGLIPMSELAWYRVHEVCDVLTPGQKVTVKVLDVDWVSNRISLSLKQCQADPWSTIRDKFQEGTVAPGTVSKLMNFGAFVELEPGIEGLIHISNFATGRKINHPKEVVSEGDQVSVKIISIDADAKRIGLELVTDSAPESVDLNEGDVLRGTVDSIKDYGLFVSLPGNNTGLLHVSEIGDANSAGELRSKHPVGSELNVEIIGLDPETKKISLSTKSLNDSQEKVQFKDYAGQASKSTFGTLADLLQDKIKK